MLFKLSAVYQDTTMTVFSIVGCLLFKSNAYVSLDRMTHEVTCHKPWLLQSVISPLSADLMLFSVSPFSFYPIFTRELDALVCPLGIALNKYQSEYPSLALSFATQLWRSLEYLTSAHSNAILQLQWGGQHYKALGWIGVFGRLLMEGGAHGRGPNIFSLNDH